MKLRTTSRLWTYSIFVIALVFVVSSAALLISIAEGQRAITQGHDLLGEVAAVESLVRQTNTAIESGAVDAVRGPEYWEAQAATLRRHLSSAALHPASDDAIRENLTEVSALLGELVPPNTPVRSVSTVSRPRVHSWSTASLVPIGKAKHQVQARIANGSVRLTQQWPYVFVVIALSCLLAGYSALISRAHRSGAQRVERVEQEANMLAHAIRSIGDAVTVTDMENRIVFVNDAFVEVYGYERKEVIGKNVDLVRSASNDPEVLHKIFPATLKGGWSGELNNQRKDGTEFPVTLTTAIVRDDRGKPMAMVGVSSDITERKHSEQVLIEARDHAEEAVKLKSAFLANMSHEIRTPLTAILGFASILSEEVDEGLREFSQLIENNGRRLLETLNSVLDLARLEANGIDIHPERVDIVEETKEAVRMLWPLANERGLRLEVDASRPSIEAEVDKTCLGRILNNLIGNAIKFTERGSVSVEVVTEGPYAKVHVRDTGIGIGDAFLPQIFEEFKQESSGVDRSHEGSGLGLAITRRLVELMWGTIEVESEKDKGTCFTITLPMFVAGDGEPSNVAPLNALKRPVEARPSISAPSLTGAASMDW